MLSNILKNICIYTDGACRNNPGPGGWASILKYKNFEREIFGNEINTTNNRMELTAIIQALKSLNQKCNVKIFSDSKYVVDAVNRGWARKWEKNNWIRSNKTKASNVDLWQELLVLLEFHIVEFNWVKGHSGHPENERCDQLATNQYKKLIK